MVESLGINLVLVFIVWFIRLDKVSGGVMKFLFEIFIVILIRIFVLFVIFCIKDCIYLVRFLLLCVLLKWMLMVDEYFVGIILVVLLLVFMVIIVIVEVLKCLVLLFKECEVIRFISFVIVGSGLCV